MNAPFHASPVKDGRRILGEKTPNACLSPRHTTSPSKRSLIDLPASSPKKLLPSPLFAGQKRSIDQVHSDVLANKAADVFVRDRTDAVSVSVSVPVPTEQDVTVSNEPQEQPQEQPTAQPQQSEQTAQDATATATVTPMKTSEMPSHNHEEKEQDQEQEPQAQQQQQDQPMTTQIPDPSNPETRKQFIQEKATLLRARLQNAMRHVRDDPQFDRRLSELEEHSRKYPRLSHPTTTSTTSTTTPNTTGIFATSTPRVVQTTMSSSSPLDGANEDLMKTPTQKSPRRGNVGSPMELSSPPAEVAGEKEQNEKGMVTPAQRGDAVDGLLKLMNTGGSSE